MVDTLRDGSLLYLDGVSVTFDGFRALNSLSLVVQRDELQAIIGPNGAGKTTMMDIITGKTRPDTGEVFFEGGIDLTKKDETEIANLGIGRKFQKPTVFGSHTVWDNIELSLKKPRGVFASWFYTRDSADTDRITAILDTVRLTHRKHEFAANLSHGQKQWLEIGMLLAQDPKLLLVDEPVAGMTDSETEETSKLLKEISKHHSVVVVEHDMSFVRDLDCRVTCLAEGAVLAQGSLEHVSSDPLVIERYLGR
ncbi:urea ABC transporter ATP-binding protein UrtD [Pelagibacterium luteolum]|uniref:Urea transport system ATP-binding protein n=1 Tax=Pelagibacterium luteolum TaxID=440168 RepID=A0A1G7STG9_9HYPH|nr:urea ABC transporter ATP-binding protein UrtD [Pelagibacterium luteolum]SDG26355.1 urea transport system ATP-binding protein [Pelagibacterium luteolum]